MNNKWLNRIYLIAGIVAVIMICATMLWQLIGVV